jgi:hypothetical protein
VRAAEEVRGGGGVVDVESRLWWSSLSWSRGAQAEVRSIQKFFTHLPVSTLDRIPFQLTGELFLYGMALMCYDMCHKNVRRPAPAAAASSSVLVIRRAPLRLLRRPPR